MKDKAILLVVLSFSVALLVLVGNIYEVIVPDSGTKTFGTIVALINIITGLVAFLRGMGEDDR